MATCTANVLWFVRFWRWPRVPSLDAWRYKVVPRWPPQGFRLSVHRYAVRRHHLPRLTHPLCRPVIVPQRAVSLSGSSDETLSARLAAAEQRVTELTARLDAANTRATAHRQQSRVWRQRAQQLTRDLAESLECPICLETLRDTQTVALVPCGHVLCAQCAQVTVQRSQCLVCSMRLQALPVGLRGLASLFACVRTC